MPAPDSLSRHVPVLLDEVLAALDVSPGMTVVDGTLGGGGHAAALLQRLGPTGRLVGIDRDPGAIEVAGRRFATSDPIHLVHGSYADLPEILGDLSLPLADAVLLDLGLSSDQLADESRGFSFTSEGELDLRFDPTRGEPAWRLLSRLSEQHLADLIYQFGEERLSRRIARNIVESRRLRPLRTSRELAELVTRSIPNHAKYRIHPATRTFQALRIAVNDELVLVQRALRRLPEAIQPSGRLAVISFHSLEDRLVKNAFRDDDRYQVINKKPIQASPEERDVNPRSRSAKLRVAVVHPQGRP